MPYESEHEIQLLVTCNMTGGMSAVSETEAGSAAAETTRGATNVVGDAGKGPGNNPPCAWAAKAGTAIATRAIERKRHGNFIEQLS